jgi:F-type H+-transporting ATPase subunit delta
MAGRPSTAARRYAEAAFGLAQRDGTQDAWRYGLRAAADAFSQPELLRIVEDPARPKAERMSVVRAVLGAESLTALVRSVADRERSTTASLPAVVETVASSVADQLINLVALLLERRGVAILPSISDEYDRLLDEARGIVRAVVTSATELTDEEASAVRERLEAMTGSRIELRRRVDPDLLGGLTVRVGDRLVDASVRGRLERLRAQLLTGSRQPHGKGAEAH